MMSLSFHCSLLFTPTFNTDKCDGFRSVSGNGQSQCKLDWIAALLNVSNIPPTPPVEVWSRQSYSCFTHTGSHAHAHTVVSSRSWRHAFSVPMRHIQRIICKKRAHPALYPASIRSVFKGGEEKGTGSQADLKTTALSSSVWQSGTLAAQTYRGYRRHYIADAH